MPILQLVDPSKKNSQYNLHKISPRQQLLFISKQLLDSSPGKYNSYEMEVKFGTKGIKHITKIDYDNVVKKLKEMNFKPTAPNGSYTLKIQPEFLDFKTGEFRTAGDFNRSLSAFALLQAAEPFQVGGELPGSDSCTVPIITFSIVSDARSYQSRPLSCKSF